MQYTDITSRALTYLLRSPHLHIDMTEAIYRGLAEICCAQPDGVLLRLRAPWNGRPFLYECSAATLERSAALLEQLEPNVPLVAHQEYTATQYQALHPCVTQRCLQGQWPSFTPPARDPEVEIWPLDLGDLPVVLEHYALIQDEEELSYLIRKGQLYGACVDDQLAGFAGTHVEGTLGLLTVLPKYRRRGLGLALERYVIRQEVRRGHIPFCQMFDDNYISLHLQQKAGMELHPQPIWWLLPHT